MLEFIRDRRHYIAAAVIGCLVRGMVYHFFPVINPILTGMLVIWPLFLIIDDLVCHRFKTDRIQVLLLGFLAAAFVSTVLNLESIRAWKFGSPADSFLSLMQGLSLVLFFYGCTRFSAEEESGPFLKRLFLAVWGYIVLLALGSAVLFALYRAGIDLPGGFGGADQIFTYGHMGEETRFCGLFGYSTDGGNLCALAAALAFFLAEQKKIPAWLAGISAVLLVYVIVLLDVRTSIVALLFCLLLAGWRFLQKKTGTGKSLLICAAAVVLLVIAAVILKRDAIMEYWILYQENPRKTIIFLTTGRSEYWELAFRGFLTKPLLGYGWLNNTYIGFYFDNHNLFFNILLWTGAIGTVLFVSASVLLFLRLCKADSTGRFGLVLIIGAVFVQAMLDRAIMGTANASPETMSFWLACGALLNGRRKPDSGK